MSRCIHKLLKSTGGRILAPLGSLGAETAKTFPPSSRRESAVDAINASWTSSLMVIMICYCLLYATFILS